ncbi:MAG TPA: DUF6029 family protein [Bacteroidales bacterium]|nr:DUF6029 family protein [Bacteroidales bacterium]HPT02693.1 DUF6029 family protein [Bacteroidales bacterium]
MSKNQILRITGILALLLLSVPVFVSAQNFLSGGQVNGNFQMDAQFYRTDSAIQAYSVPEKMMMNSWTNLTYNLGNFNAGMRFETYLNPVNGYDPRYKGAGVPYWFADYKSDQFQVTAGNIYEQFGSGMAFRTYEEHNLGYDNSLRGVRVKFTPVDGVEFKGIWGTQRYFWDQGAGIVRGGDVDFNLNRVIRHFESSKLKVQLGGSFVSKYQADETITDNDGNELILPLNVGITAGRVNLGYDNFSLATEYAYKINDPSALNNYIYRPGQSLLVTATYSKKGLGMMLQAKRIDNMSYKSKRTETGNVLDINYLPAITRQHTYSLAAMYPYATQPNGEMGVQGQVNYKIKKGTWLGGHYGTDIALNFSAIASPKYEMIDTIAISTPGTKGYESPFFAIGDELYYRDINLEIGHKFSKKFKGILTLMHEDYNIEVIEGHPGEEMVHANIAIADLTYKFTDTHSLRGEFQVLQTKQDDGSWLTGLLEYTIAPKWFFSVTDMYNYGNDDSDNRLHYPLVAVAYNNNANRIQVSYGKQREGIVCVGGVCRNVPASNGFTISITSSF